MPLMRHELAASNLEEIAFAFEEEDKTYAACLQRFSEELHVSRAC